MAKDSFALIIGALAYIIIIVLTIWFGYWFISTMNDIATTNHQIHEQLMEINNG